jgi:hypothetical protein
MSCVNPALSGGAGGQIEVGIQGGSAIAPDRLISAILDGALTRDN